MIYSSTAPHVGVTQYHLSIFTSPDHQPASESKSGQERGHDLLRDSLVSGQTYFFWSLLFPLSLDYLWICFPNASKPTNPNYRPFQQSGSDFVVIQKRKLHQGRKIQHFPVPQAVKLLLEEKICFNIFVDVGMEGRSFFGGASMNMTLFNTGCWNLRFCNKSWLWVEKNNVQCAKKIKWTVI